MPNQQCVKGELWSRVVTENCGMNYIESSDAVAVIYAQKWVRKTSRHTCILKVLSGIGL
jgi:hypothetical protein